jgi:hypothetical protein
MIQRTRGYCPPLGVPLGLRLARLSHLNEDRDLLFALRGEGRSGPVTPLVLQLNPDIFAIEGSSEGQPVDPWSSVTASQGDGRL